MAESTKKVGLVTFYSDNYGSCLQAFALYNIIKEIGYNTKVVKYVREAIGGGYFWL